MSGSIDASQLLQNVQEISQKINSTPLISRDFITISSQQNLDQKKQGEQPIIEDSLRVMQWNLLAQGLCISSDGFILCPPAALDWKFRQMRILEEMLTYSADIYCLEEVDNFSTIHKHLVQLGYSGCFCPKPDSPCLYQPNNHGPDGCALFWRAAQFKLCDQHNLILGDDNNRNTDQVALVCRFQGLVGYLTDREFLCVATHLKAKTGYDELRFQQGKFLEKYLRRKAAGLPVILCGDFNADPQSKAVQVFKASQLELTSAYSLLSSSGEEPPYTSWKVRAGKRGQRPYQDCHTIDYLFFSSAHFQVVRLLKLPTPEDIGPGFLPSYSYPSDHISLVADMKLLEADSCF